MAEAIEKVPAETRWEIAAKGLTGASTAIDKALKDAIGENKFNEFARELWYETGKGAKEFADNLGLATENANDIVEVLKLLSLTAMGPEFNFEIIRLLSINNPISESEYIKLNAAEITDKIYEEVRSSFGRKRSKGSRRYYWG